MSSIRPGAWETKQKPEQVYDNNVELDCPGLLAYGVSLGAHISGFVGKIFHGRVGRITGLDPAGPQFSGKPSHGRLDYTDANFVDVIHTDINGLEFIKCDHQRAVYLFMAALETNCNFISFSCRSYKDYKTGLCADCADFKEKSCPKLGYQTELWKDILKERIENTTLRTTVFLDTVGTNPFCTYYFVLSIIVLDKNMKDGYVTFKLLNQLGIVEEPRLYESGEVLWLRLEQSGHSSDPHGLMTENLVRHAGSLMLPAGSFAVAHEFSICGGNEKA
ncbi:hypothetical protein MJG53_001167 [Ovis ammon polii x Ovis aries]|uniref:Uncharacterized protein n=1 Tax=Ovis ammon polii x Ovis aries TaxID=2918886 RepID=A0ACB9VJX7_9CETA|nr:hypothetical protein MJT46_000663 [Ovis ammon polii x Ovis aries]KAI4590118.1 hypothetical protein MJG53_001167 [Ovis ammon polii x Ovis aries]